MTAHNAQLEYRKLIPLAALGGAMGALLNTALFFAAPVLIGEVIRVVLPTSKALEPLPLVAVISASLMPAFAGAAALWLLARFTRAPLLIFQIAAAIIAPLSCVSLFSMPIGLGTKLILSAMHVIAAASIVIALSNTRANPAASAQPGTSRSL